MKKTLKSIEQVSTVKLLGEIKSSNLKGSGMGDGYLPPPRPRGNPAYPPK